MNRFWIFVISIIVFGGVQYANAQNDNLDMELEVTDEEKIMLFSGFAVAVIAIVLFLARDIILRRKTSYDKEDLESKKDKTFEKYHSDWGDDYEELGQRKNTKEDKEFEIKKKFRELAMKTHPDKTKEDSENEMAELNKAYEILSDKERREKYDRYLKVD
jgi:molecular chaperone DnaJ